MKDTEVSSLEVREKLGNFMWSIYEKNVVASAFGEESVGIIKSFIMQEPEWTQFHYENFAKHLRKREEIIDATIGSAQDFKLSLFETRDFSPELARNISFTINGTYRQFAIPILWGS